MSEKSFIRVYLARFRETHPSHERRNPAATSGATSCPQQYSAETDLLLLLAAKNRYQTVVCLHSH
jgi:hypothetical protein